jgi:hypothetical protein
MRNEMKWSSVAVVLAFALVGCESNSDDTAESTGTEAAEGGDATEGGEATAEEGGEATEEEGGEATEEEGGEATEEEGGEATEEEGGEATEEEGGEATEEEGGEATEEEGGEATEEEGGEATEEEGGEAIEGGETIEGGEGTAMWSECGELMECANGCDGYGLDDAGVTLAACLAGCGSEASEETQALLADYAACLGANCLDEVLLVDDASALAACVSTSCSAQSDACTEIGVTCSEIWHCDLACLSGDCGCDENVSGPGLATYEVLDDCLGVCPKPVTQACIVDKVGYTGICRDEAEACLPGVAGGKCTDTVACILDGCQQGDIACMEACFFGAKMENHVYSAQYVACVEANCTEFPYTAECKQKAKDELCQTQWSSCNNSDF